jgi:hypothetical protein
MRFILMRVRVSSIVHGCDDQAPMIEIAVNDE